MRNHSGLLARSRAAIIVENSNEKIERKILVQERKHERILEQQQLAQRMEHLMEKVEHFLFLHTTTIITHQVLREAPLSKKDEHHLRNQMKTIAEKVHKESNVSI